MGFQRTIEPTELFITLGEAKDHLRVTHDDEDALIEEKILVAANAIEQFIRRALMPQTLEYTLNAFPSGNILLPFSPIQSVKSPDGNIKYIDADGIEQTWGETEYDVFTNKIPGYIRLAFDKSYPSIRSTQDAIKITYLAGYARRELIPPMIRHAGLLTIAHFYQNRQDSKIPDGAETLLYPHRIFRP